MGLKIISDNVEDLKRTITFFYEFLPCNYRRQTRFSYRKLLARSRSYIQPNISIMGQYQGPGGVADVRFYLTAFPKHPTGQGPVVQTVTRSCGQVYTRAQSVTALHRPQSRPESRTANTDRPARASQAAQSCEFSANPGVSDLAVCRLCAKLRPSPPGPRGDIGVVTP